jgi:Flp pilus assembly pilin Flp
MAASAACDDQLSMPRFLSSFRRSDGQTMAEYAVVISVITPAIVLMIALLSGAAENAIRSVVNTL